MIFFKTIRWKNLLSTGNSWTELDFSKNKNTLIMGENGAGKSTLLDALSYVLYGKAYRNIRKPQLINSVNQKGLLVEIEFETAGKEYLVRRGMKPNVFEIYQNGNLIDQTARLKDNQDYFERDVLKMNHKSFSQIVILGSSTFIPFMQLTPAQRREVIEDLLDLQIFSRMNDVLKKKIAQNKDDIKELEYQIKLNVEKIELQKKHLQEFVANNKAMIARKKERIEELKGNIKNLSENVEKLSNEIEILSKKLLEVENLNKKMQKYDSVKNQLLDSMRNVKKREKFFQENSSCPTCKQDISEELKTEKFSQAVSKQEEIRKGLEILENQKDNLRDKIERFNEISSQISSKNIVLTKINQEIYSNNQTIENLRDEIEEVSQVHPEDNISELKNENEVLQKRKTELNQLHSVYKLGSEMLKDSGIKSRIIKQYVPIMNKLINYYLSQLGFFVQFELDENFNETIKSRYLDEFSYDSFSEGEKNRIDVALLATWRKIAKMRNSVSTNLLIMDEIFDGSLDETGIECLLGLFDESFEDSNIFIITHKKESYDRFENKIIFQKKGNFSVMT